MSAIFEDMVSAIVRPPRAIYAPLDLGPNRLRCRGVEYKRTDFETHNDRNQRIRGSLWELMHKHATSANNDFCILYLHPNSGSRVDVVRTKIMAVAAQSQCAVCSFDFSGCGLSDGDFISLGVREKEDVAAVLVHLIEHGFRRFMLWGRSMGAATSVMFYGAYKPLLQGMVVSMLLDSPFTSFEGLADDYTQSKINIPRLLLSPAVHYLKKIVEQKYNFDLLQMSPISAAHDVDVLTVVLSGRDDKIVSPKLSEELYEIVGGPKMRIFFEGGHNTHRPPEIFEAIQQTVHGSLHALPVVDVLAELEKILLPEGAKSKIATLGKEAEAKPSSEELALKRIDDIFAPLSSGNSSPATNISSISPVANQSILNRDTSNLTPDEMEKEAERMAKETEEAFTNLLKTKSLKKLTQTDVHMAINSIREKPDGTFEDSKTQVDVSETTYGGSNGASAKLTTSSVTTDSSPTAEYKLLFGSQKAGTVGLLGDFPQAAPKPDLPRGILSQKQKHVPPGMSVAGSHFAKGKGKPSTVIGISMSIPETHNYSKRDERGVKHSVSTTSTTSTEISSKQAASSGESSWLGVLSMGYLGTVAEPEPMNHAQKYSHSFCPPSVVSWNKLASARAMVVVEENILDLTIDMAISLTCELMKGKFNISQSLPEDQFSIMLSLAVAEVFADVGSSFSVEKDTVSWILAIQHFIDLPPGFKVKTAKSNLDKAGVIAPCPAVLKSQAALSEKSIIEKEKASSPTRKKKGSSTSLHNMSTTSALHGMHVPVPVATTHAHVNVSHHFQNGKTTYEKDSLKNDALVSGNPFPVRKRTEKSTESY